MDLSNVFDTLNHRLLLAKVHRLQLTILKQMKGYRTVRHQITTANNAYSSWSEIIAGVPHGLILGPILFNSILNDLLFYPAKTFWSNYADVNTLYEIGNTVNKVKKKKNSAIISKSLSIGFTKT